MRTGGRPFRRELNRLESGADDLSDFVSQPDDNEITVMSQCAVYFGVTIEQMGSLPSAATPPSLKLPPDRCIWCR